MRELREPRQLWTNGKVSITDEASYIPQSDRHLDSTVMQQTEKKKIHHKITAYKRG